MADNDKVDILIVDDVPEKVFVLESVLSELNENLVTARSGTEALRHVLEREFAVILLDVNMPGMDGFETAELIRARKKSAHTPIMFLTAFADEMLTARGYSLGAVDYILSPVVPDFLRSKVKVFVDLFRMTRQVKRQAEERIALAQEQAARAAAEEATRRSGFLAEASKVLARSLDVEDTLRALARLSVPFLADLCGVTFVEEPGKPWITELALVRPDETVGAGGLSANQGPRDELHSAVERVLQSGKAELLDELAVEFPPANSTPIDPTPRQSLRSAVVLPLVARDRILGALTLGRRASQNRAIDQDLAEDFAGRAAFALDNARLYRSIQESDRRKNEFLAMLAHELRNPLAPIRNACQILRLLAPNQPELVSARDMIDRQVHHLVRLVDDLLDISRITRGKIQLRAEPVEVTSVLARALEVSRPLIEAREHQLTVNEPPEPLWVRADPMRLAQVLANLLNNAAKYTEPGGHITVSAGREGEEAVFRVRDTGMGIPPEMIGSIFDLFTQAERSLDRAQGGLGIGLTLVKRLVELHGGTVEAHSVGAGHGSEFVVRLPALAERPELPEHSSGAGGEEAGKPVRVLLVDDNVDAAESLATLLRLQSHEVRLAHEGLTAVKTAESFRPDVVLLDIGLPGMDGYEVAHRLRAETGLNETLLVALTGYGQEDYRRRSRAAGIDVHMVKPVDLEALYTLLARPAELRAELDSLAPA
jgi:signal transduction histidine kinase/DNA-binding response OmpR family regulator